MVVYKLTNRVTGLSYIGSTKRPLHERLAKHRFYAARGMTFPICSAIREVGWPAFDVTELCRAGSAEELAEKERAAILLYNTLVPHGYNLSPGGPGLSRPVSEETREKQRVSHLGQPSAMKGKTHSPEIRAKMSAARKGKGWNQREVEFNGVTYPSVSAAASATGLSRVQLLRRLQLGIAKYLAPSKLPVGFGSWNKGKKTSDEVRQRQSAQRKGRTFWRMRAIEYQGVAYASVDEAMQKTGLTRQNFKTLVKRGEATYLTALKRLTSEE